MFSNYFRYLEWIIGIAEVHVADEVSGLDRVPRGEVPEKKWLLVPIGKKKFEKGPTKITFRANGGVDAGLEVKSLLLKKTD
jgi:hypothetical protein